MAKPRTLRFAAGGPEAPFSGIWRVVATKNDVYLGPSKAAMGAIKVSLHHSGVWTVAGTSQSGVTFEKGNRRAKQWVRPKPHFPGVTRGPSILVPHTSLGARSLPPSEDGDEIVWYPAPSSGETVDFSIYIVEAGISPDWGGRPTVGERSLANGSRVIVLAETRDLTPELQEAIEKKLRDSVVGVSGPSDGYLGGSFLWVTQSPGTMKIPIIVDLPVDFRRS